MAVSVSFFDFFPSIFMILLHLFSLNHVSWNLKGLGNLFALGFGTKRIGEWSNSHVVRTQKLAQENFSLHSCSHRYNQSLFNMSPALSFIIPSKFWANHSKVNQFHIINEISTRFCFTTFKFSPSPFLFLLKISLKSPKTIQALWIFDPRIFRNQLRLYMT